MFFQLEILSQLKCTDSPSWCFREREHLSIALHTALLEMMPFFIELWQTTIRETNFECWVCEASVSFQWVNAVSSTPPLFIPYHHALFQSHRPPQQSVRQGNITVVRFDALQTKYSVLCFKTLSIRLTEACVSCIYLACGDVQYRSCTFLACLKCTHIYTWY